MRVVNAFTDDALGDLDAVGMVDAMRTGRGTANMIQGQRDFFGRHGFERIDAEGAFHGPWAES